MNGFEGYYDVYRFIPKPNFMGIGATLGDDDQDGGNIRRNVGCTPQQIQELENFYKECPHPSEEQKSELGRMLNLETQQVMCWFQNKRTQARAYDDHHENDFYQNGFLMSWIEQAKYEESQIPQLNQRLIGSGTGLGAKRWLTTLQSHGKNLPTISTISTVEVNQGLSSKVATEIVKLAQRMTVNYCTGITGSPAGKWERANVENERQNMRLMTRKNVNVRGEPTGIVLSAATSVWFPVSKTTMFDFLNNQSLRDKWDILTTDVTSIEEKIKIEKSRIDGNYVSFLQIDDGISVLQETWNDASSALLVYAPVEKDSMEEIMRGENSDSVQILPTGFSILPDGGETGPDQNGGGCLLALGYQFLVSDKPTADVDQDFLKHVEKLMDHTIDNIKSALSISS